MTTISEVAVKLGLNSEEFIKGVDKAENECKELEVKLNQTKESFEKMSKAMAMTKKPTKEMENVFKTLKQELNKNQSAFDKTKEKIKQFGGQIEQTNPIVQELQNKMLNLAKIGFWIAATKKIVEMGKAAVKTASQFEQLSVSFEVLAGGAEAGQKLTNQIIELASKTPMTTQSLSDGARMLLSFGESANEVINDLKLLGDITGGDAQRMQSLTLAFAQVGSQGKLAGQDLLQMINAGFNPLEQISKKTGKSVGQLKDEMSKGLITFNDVKQAMIEATSEGGRFYGMMNKQSETLEGRMSTLSDTWDLINKRIGDKFLPYIKECINKFIELGKAVDTPLNNNLNVLDGLLKTIGSGLKGIRDLIGFIIPGTNTLSDLFATLNTNAAKLGLTLQYAFAPLMALQRDKSFKDVFDKWKELNAQWRGIDTDYYNKLSGGKYKPLLEELNEVNAKVKETKDGFDTLSGGGTGNKEGNGSKQDTALEDYKKYIEEYAKLNDDYEAILKARQKVEGQLNINPVLQQDEYKRTLVIYQNYYAKMSEIARSGAKNKAEIEKLEEEKLARDLQELRLEKEQETRQKLQDMIIEYKTAQKDLEYQNRGESELGGFIGRFRVGYQQRLEVLKWYYKERETIAQAHFITLGEQQEAFNQLEQTKMLKEAEITKEIWQDRANDIAGIFNNTFSTMLTNYGDFSDNMKQLAINLSTYLAKEFGKAAFSWIMQLQEGQNNVLTGFASTINNLSNSLAEVGQGAGIAANGIQAIQTTQSALQPIQTAMSAASAVTSQQYIAQATAAQQLAAATAQLAISEAALSVAKIPFVGGFMAPAAAAATGAGIAAAVAMVTASSIFSKLGNFSKSSSGVGQLATLPKHHSGGMIPGTKEQVAVLQGGERVLNRAETQSYNSDTEGNNQGTTIINAFNIKAFDGKDVINTLKEHAQTINQITANGIKNNNQGLRTVVQNI